jgi:phosphopantothenoylcysteine decarboxylase/phosphopantothenate--cysteine ligase
MAAAVAAALPADIAVMVAAVADWRVDAAGHKLKKTGDGPPALQLVENPDILATIGHAPDRPKLVIGFAAETADLLSNAGAKLAKKGADWIIANDVGSGVFGSDSNHVHRLSAAGIEDWGPATKAQVAQRLVEAIADAF